MVFLGVLTGNIRTKVEYTTTTLRMSGFTPRSALERLVVVTVPLEQAFIRALLLVCVSIVTSVLHIYLPPTVLCNISEIQRHLMQHLSLSFCLYLVQCSSDVSTDWVRTFKVII